MEVSALDTRKFELYCRFGISLLLLKSGYGAVKAAVEEHFQGYTFEELLKIARKNITSEIGR